MGRRCSTADPYETDLDRMMYGLIIAGGSGTRLWPLSRSSNPKQLLSLNGEERSLLQETYRRLARTIVDERIMVVTSATYGDQVLRQLRQVFPTYAPRNVLGEPVRRNSAPAVLWGALRIAEESPEAVVAVVWADHAIRNVERFDAALRQAAGVAAQGHLVTIGVRPTRPDTGFGYIESGAHAGEGVYEVRRFVEKPDRQTAERFMAEGRFCWNAGLFVFRVDTLLGEYRRLAPELMEAFERHRATENGGGWNDPARIAAIYREISESSIDYLLLEKTNRLRVIPCDLDWCDLGSWDVLYDNSPKDEAGNVVIGNAVALDSRNSLIRAGKRLIATVGVENLIIVDTDDALLVCDLRKVQDVKKLVSVLRERGCPQIHDTATTHRPWGSFTTLSEGPGFKLKLIEVLPDQKLSLQLHHHRAEHWIIMEGTALVVKGLEERTLHENDHIHIDKGERHRIANPASNPLRILELQQGNYLGEDDIVRFEDIYGRA